MPDYWIEVGLIAEGSVIGHIDRSFLGYFRLQKKCLDGSQFPSFSGMLFMQTAPLKFITIQPAAMDATVPFSQIIYFPCNQLQEFGFLAYSVLHMSETGRSSPQVGPQVYPAEVYKDALLTFVDPRIIVQFINKNPTGCKNVSKFYCSIFI